MRRTPKLARVLAALSAVALLAAACGDDDEPTGTDGTATETDGDATDGDTDGQAGAYCDGAEERDVIWAHEQEPPDMHLDDPNNNQSITSWIQQSMLEGLFGNTADVSFFPELVAEFDGPNPTDAGGMTVDYTLREGLQWSDGTPFTAEQVKQMYDLIMEGVDPETGEGGVLLYADRANYLTIEGVEVTSDTEFTITWSEPFSGWQSLFARIYPTHVLDADGDGTPEAETANEALREWQVEGEPLPSTGPMIWDEWTRGTSMHLVRNDDYHGNVSPDAENDGVACVNGVQINFVPDTDTQINALKAGEADFIFAQPQTQFGERIATDEDFTIAVEPGPSWEHWGFNLLNPHLEDVNVREAIAFAIDKPDLMNTLYTPIYGDAVPEEGLGNSFWMSNQPAYIDHQGQAGYGQGDVEAAQAALEAAGYTAGSDGIYEHPEKGRLSLRVGTTGGNALRELQQEIVQGQLNEVGIEITIDNVPGSDYFTQRVFSAEASQCAMTQGAEGDCSVWDITQFAWVGGPWPGSGLPSWETGEGINPYGYSNPDYDTKAAECRQALGDEALATCFNEASELVVLRTDDDTGVVVVPLTQKPNFFAYSNVRLETAGVAVDTNDAGPLANVVDYKPAA